MNVIEQNNKNWNEKVRQGNPWTLPVSSELVANARRGEWNISVTATKPVPAGWFPALKGKDILCLASGGGQQGPILAAAGANVTVLDFSEAQLSQDRLVAEKENLTIQTVCADMSDLSIFANQQFDIIIHPVSNLYIAQIQPVWNEAFRVLKDGGILISGFMNPVFYLFDWDLQEKGLLQVNHPLPYSDLDYLTAEEPDQQENNAVEFGHTLETQIQGQMSAGFFLTGFYEDTFGGEKPLDQYCGSFIATRAVKPVK